jgi:hypothetical protein
LSKKNPGFVSGAASSSLSSLVHTRELMGQADIVDWQGDLRILGLTAKTGFKVQGLRRQEAANGETVRAPFK